VRAGLGRYPEGMITPVELPDELLAALKRVAAAENRPVDAAIVAAVERYVAERNRREHVRELATQVAEQDAELLDRLAR
jgi:predicted transcriptional regulator